MIFDLPQISPPQLITDQRLNYSMLFESPLLFRPLQGFGELLDMK